MKYFPAWPSWMLTRALCPFLPKTHPWRGRRFSLKDWYLGRTKFTMDFDTVMWFILPFLITFILTHK